MMTKKSFAVLGLAVLAVTQFSSEAHAFGRRQPIPDPVLDISIDQIQIAGTGCAEGSATSEVSEDRSLIRLHTPLVAAVDSARKLDRKACTAVISISKIPAGKRLVVSEVLVQGAADLGAGALGKLSHETFLAGQVNPVSEQELGALDQDVVREVILQQADATASECGGSDSVLLRTNTSLMLRNAAQARASSASIGLVQLKLRLEACAQ